MIFFFSVFKLQSDWRKFIIDLHTFLLSFFKDLEVSLSQCKFLILCVIFYYNQHLMSLFSNFNCNRLLACCWDWHYTKLIWSIIYFSCSYTRKKSNRKKFIYLQNWSRLKMRILFWSFNEEQSLCSLIKMCHLVAVFKEKC